MKRPDSTFAQLVAASAAKEKAEEEEQMLERNRTNLVMERSSRE